MMKEVDYAQLEVNVIQIMEQQQAAQGASMARQQELRHVLNAHLVLGAKMVELLL